MPRVTLTDRSLRTLAAPKAGRSTYLDKTLPGFGLRVTANGARSWVVVYRHQGRKRRVTLGAHPTLGLADAREKAKRLLARVVQGEDPAAERRAAHEAATLAEVAREYIEQHAKKVNRSWREKERMLETDVVPAWGSRKARDITARDVRLLVDGIVDRGAPIAANRTFALIHRVFNWAAAPDRALVPQHHNPCRGMERPAPERQRDRVLSAEELRAIWRALDGEDAVNAALFKLFLFTAQRGGELRTMRWEDVDLEAAWWTIPAERAKNSIAHRVPLSPQALSILRDLRERTNGSPWLFPSARAATGCRTTLTKAAARIREASGVAFVPHDLRRTVATFLTSELGVSRLVVSKLLNHVERGVTAVYDRASYDREKQAALNAWGARLEAIVRGETRSAKVLAFPT
jgi:integrase